jgi:hypothetical protein
MTPLVELVATGPTAPGKYSGGGRVFAGGPPIVFARREADFLLARLGDVLRALH